MRVISEKALREFWKAHPDAEQALRTWLTLANRAAWHTPDDIKRDFASASFLANNRVVFNICGNNYRLVVLVLYRPGYLYIRFIGTHAAYDRIDAETVEEVIMADIHPIRDKADYERALAEIDAIIKQNPDGNTPDGERLELLSLLVSDYEAKQNPIQPPDDPVEVIQFYMDQKGLTRKDMEQYLGNKARVSDILNRRRSLSLPMIRRLSQGLGIPADLLIAPTRRSSYQQQNGTRIYPAP